jgi:hypothetical protein
MKAKQKGRTFSFRLPEKEDQIYRSLIDRMKTKAGTLSAEIITQWINQELRG